MLALAILSQLVPIALGAIGPVANVHVANKVVSPDGFSRSAVLVGADANSLSFPGPLIIGNKGTTFALNVVDALTDTTMLRATSIHWHGFFVSGAAWADGAAGVTQCPIAPGHSFLYKFGAKDQAGTFWYHSHHSSQYCDGLRGAMVVYDPADPHRSRYDVDNEDTVLTLADWYHTPAPLLAGVVPRPDSTLINGKGRYPGGPAAPLSVIVVKPNTRYRFRLISMACDPNYTFSIDGHTMTIIEADGINTKPLEVDSIQIFAGQRYSFVLNANKTPANYWVRANPNTGTPGFAGGINSAILRYDDPKVTPVDPPAAPNPPKSVLPLLETNLKPLVNTPAPGRPTRNGVDVDIRLNIELDASIPAYKVNGKLFKEPKVPIMLGILSGASTPQQLLPDGELIVLPKNSDIQISMNGGGLGSPHPMHLHGHAFSVVRSAGSSTYNYADPVQRDVVNIGELDNDNVTIRFRTDNPGPWFFHCHIDWHLIAGLTVVFAEDVPTIAATPNQPAAWKDLCPIYDALPHPI